MTRAVTAFVVASALVMAGCADDGSVADTSTTTAATTTSAAPRNSASPDPAVARATDVLVGQLETMDAASLTIVDYLFRNWGIGALAGARAIAERRLAGGGTLSDDELVLARLVDPDAGPPAGMEDLSEPTTALLATALHCDQVDLPAEFFDGVTELTSQGGYGATHAGLAVGWMRELGCDSDELAAATNEVVARIGSDFAARTEVTDLAVEQSSLLFYLGAGDRVPASWADDVRAAQRDDGGWGPGSTTWHMTMLAIWTLSALAAPGGGVALVGPAAS